MEELKKLLEGGVPKTVEECSETLKLINENQFYKDIRVLSEKLYWKVQDGDGVDKKVLHQQLAAEWAAEMHLENIDIDNVTQDYNSTDYFNPKIVTVVVFTYESRVKVTLTFTEEKESRMMDYQCAPYEVIPNNILEGIEHNLDSLVQCFE